MRCCAGRRPGARSSWTRALSSRSRSQGWPAGSSRGRTNPATTKRQHATRQDTTGSVRHVQAFEDDGRSRWWQPRTFSLGFSMGSSPPRVRTVVVKAGGMDGLSRPGPPPSATSPLKLAVGAVLAHEGGKHKHQHKHKFSDRSSLPASTSDTTGQLASLQERSAPTTWHATSWWKSDGHLLPPSFF